MGLTSFPYLLPTRTMWILPIHPPVNRSMSAMTAGALASFMACPVEVCLVRMQVGVVRRTRGATGKGWCTCLFVCI